METRSLTKAEMRVEVAKDVLKSLRVLNVKSGIYIKEPTGKLPENLNESNKVAKEFKKTCQVCALGAAFLSQVCLFNKFDFSKNYEIFENHDYWTDSVVKYGEVNLDDFQNKLEQLFTPLQMALIESAFERNDMSLDGLMDYKIGETKKIENQITKAINFGCAITDDKQRLRAIMKNIVANNGTFIP